MAELAAEAEPQIAEAVLALHRRADEVWPGIRVEPERLAGEIARRIRGTNVAGLHPDLVLVVAAMDGDPAAIAACEQHLTREIEFTTRQFRAGPSQGDDLRSDLQRLVFTSEPDRVSALTSFTGRGDLRGYLRVIAARAFARQRQREHREVSIDDEVLDAFTPAIEPEVAYLREHYRAEVDAAVRACIALLSDRHRAVLRFHLIDGWSIDQIGERYGVHRATAARWLTTAREDLGERIRGQLASQLAISTSQVDSIVALVTSRIEISLDRLLAG